MVENRHLGVLTREVGSGKSVLIRRLFQDLDSIQYLHIYICRDLLRPQDFYGKLLRQLGEVPPYSLAKAKRLWPEALEARREQVDKSPVVVVGEAQKMTETMLTELRFAVNHQMDSCSLFPLILVGQSELRRTLRPKKYEAVAQRIPMQYHLSGLTPKAYIRHQMQTANLATPVFAESAVTQVHVASQGIPRVINLICTQALYDAAQRGHNVVEESHIIRILADLDRQRGITA